MNLTRRKVLIFVAILFGLFMNPQPIHTQPAYYVWTDENGRVRFADDYSKIPDKYKSQAVPGPAKRPARKLDQTPNQDTVKGKAPVPETGEVRQYESRGRDAQSLLSTLISRTPGIISGAWTQKESAWLKVPANWANNKPVCREIAETAANFLSSQLGYMVCVHLYYGNFNEIARACG